jgi:hypothetical protein
VSCVKMAKINIQILLYFYDQVNLLQPGVKLSLWSSEKVRCLGLLVLNGLQHCVDAYLLDTSTFNI